MKLSQSSLALLEDTLKKAIGKYTCGCEQTIVTDIHLQPNQNSGELSIFDDEDKELANTTIEEWMTYEGDDFYESSPLLDVLSGDNERRWRRHHYFQYNRTRPQ